MSQIKELSRHHGMLWEVPLTHSLGYAYIHLIDTNVYNGGYWLYKIMDYLSPEQQKKITLDQFNSWDMLTSPIVGGGPPPQRGEAKWKKLGYFPLSSIDLTMPLCKTGVITIDGTDDWEIIKNLKPQDWEGGYRYDQVKHLGWINPLTFLIHAHHRIAIEWMKYLGMDYENYTSDKVDNGFLNKLKHQVKYGVRYTEVPMEIRGKVNLNPKQ